MSEKPDKSTVEIVLGPNKVRVKGSEDFVSNELGTILDQVNLAQSVEPKDESKQNEHKDMERDAPGQQTALNGHDVRSETNDENGSDPLQKVSRQIGVPKEALQEHFYVEERESDIEVHIQNPINISGKYALLGYCTIREVLTDVTYHSNQETKKKLIDGEKVDIDSWGRKFLHKLRNEGLIKDDPNTNKKRNRPFKITPTGRREFIKWLGS